MEMTSDQQLLLDAAAGNQAAFCALYDRHRDAVYRFAWALTRSGLDAEEIAQDSFLILLRKASDFRPESAPLRTWLLGMTRNLCYRHRGLAGPSGDDAPDLADESEMAAIEAHLIRSETAEAVRRAVMTLPEAQREAIVLFELEELSLAETAAVLGIEANAVKARLFRGRERLKQILLSLAPQGRKR